MKIELIGWRARNLRGYLRHADIDLDSSHSRWILLQMPNGTGKTTTMELLRAAFSGQGLNADSISSLKADDLVEDGSFEMKILIDKEPWLIEMEFDFRRERCNFFTTSLGEKSGGRRSGHILPGLLKETLRKDITEFFIFNGELAAEILEIGRDRADNAIRFLYQLDRLSDLKGEIAQLEDKQRKRASAVTSAGTKNAKNRFSAEAEEAKSALEALEADERQLIKQTAQCLKDLKVVERELNDLEAKSKQFADEMAQVKRDIEEVERRQKDFGEKSLETFRSPPLFHGSLMERLSSLGGKLKELRLPRTMSAEFFHQLAEREACICDRPIGPDEQAAIKTNADEFLGQDQIAVINQMKFALREIKPEVDSFKAVAEHLRGARNEHQLLVQRKRRLEEEMAEAGADEYAALLDKREKLKREQDRADDAIYQLTHADGTRDDLAWKSNIPLCRAELKIRKRRLETVLGTYVFMQRAGRLRELVNQVEAGSLKRLRQRIREDTNEILDQILPNEKLRVSAIDGSLRLETVAVAKKTGVSEGQKLAVSYAFLTALLAKAPYDLPFVVDSPAVSLDVEIRRTVAKLIPGLFDQMIMFVISSERDGFADSFYDRSDAKFITIAIEEGGGTELREGVDAFKAFHTSEGAKR